MAELLGHATDLLGELLLADRVVGLVDEGIDLAVPAGAMLGLIGPDGVGKSTLLNALTGAEAFVEEDR